jgi:hypothetical protein
VNLRSLFRWGPDPEVKAFVADLNGVQYSSYTNQRMWLRFVNVLIVSYIWALLTDHVERLTDALTFIGVVGTFLTGKSVVTAASRYGKSKQSEKAIEAKERGKASATPTVHADKVEKMEVTPPKEHAEGTREEPEWSRGDPRAGVL